MKDKTLAAPVSYYKIAFVSLDKIGVQLERQLTQLSKVQNLLEREDDDEMVDRIADLYDQLEDLIGDIASAAADLEEKL